MMSSIIVNFAVLCAVLLATTTVFAAPPTCQTDFTIYSSLAESTVAGTSTGSPFPTRTNCFVDNGVHLAPGYLIDPVGHVCCSQAGFVSGSTCSGTISCHLITTSSYVTDNSGNNCMFASSCFTIDPAYIDTTYHAQGSYSVFAPKTYAVAKTSTSLDGIGWETDVCSTFTSYDVVVSDTEAYLCGFQGVTQYSGSTPTGCQKTICNSKIRDYTTNYIYNPSQSTPVCYANCVFMDCGGANLNTDVNNCGTCGNVCSAPNVDTYQCVAGFCGIQTCSFGWADCNGDFTDGCEADVTAPTQCGTCGNDCTAIELTACNQTTLICAKPCASGFADCNNDLSDGCETSISDQVTTCGSCTTNCNNVVNNNHVSTLICSTGVCSALCSTGYANCDNTTITNGCNIHISSDPSNCGSCGAACSNVNIQTQACTSGNCAGTCKLNWANCDNTLRTNGCNVSLTSNPNCGACGVTCGSGKTCTKNNITLKYSCV